MNIYEIKTRPPNSNSSMLNNHQLSQNQFQNQQYLSRRTAHIQNALKQQRSSSVSSSNAIHNSQLPNTAIKAQIPVTQVRLKNSETPKPSSIGRSFNYFTNNSTPSSPLISTHHGHNSGKYVARVVTNNNGLRTLVSTSASYLPTDSTEDLTSLTTRNNISTNKATVLPVYYQNENLITTLPIISPLSTQSSSASSSSSSSSVSSSNLLRNGTGPFPNLVSNSACSGVGSATAIVHNNSSNNNIRNLSFQQSPSFNHSRINKIQSSNNSSDSFAYPIQLSAKQYSVLKGIKARNDMLNMGQPSASNNFSSPSSSTKTASNISTNNSIRTIPMNSTRSNYCYFNGRSDEDNLKSNSNLKFNFINNLASHLLMNDQNRLKNNDSPSSNFSNVSTNTNNTDKSSSTSGTWTSASTTTNSNNNQKSILVNRKKFANPPNSILNNNTSNSSPFMPKKTVTFASS